MVHRTIEEIIQSRDDTMLGNLFENDEPESNPKSEYLSDSKDIAFICNEECQLGRCEINPNQAARSDIKNSQSASTSDNNRSYASVALNSCDVNEENLRSTPLCSFFQNNGYCVYPRCSLVHGNLCDLCGYFSVHPFNKEQSDKHREECIKEHEESMELSFAYQNSKDLTCAICLDVVYEKSFKGNQRFGILINCSHIFCIECIRKWRVAKNTDFTQKRRCPVCRIQSEIIIPSEYFYKEGDQKQKLIDDYKKALGSKHCKYFKRGKGRCPFDETCFYKHEYPDGTKPEPQPTNRSSYNRNLQEAIESLQSEFQSNLRAILNGDIFDDYLINEIDDDSDESDDYEFYFEIE
ncbi:hypothetical protein SSS_05583 [Sarcoptes scabiei]|nr:hypothetical protein SSS_05583 [Sarcoptes scabiei]